MVRRTGHPQIDHDLDHLLDPNQPLWHAVRGLYACSTGPTQGKSATTVVGLADYTAFQYYGGP